MLRIFFLFLVFQSFDLLSSGLFKDGGRGVGEGLGQVLAPSIEKAGKDFVFGCGIVAIAGVATALTVHVADRFFPSPHDKLAIAQAQEIQRTRGKEELQESILKDYAQCRCESGCNYHELALRYALSGGDLLVLGLVEKEALLSQYHKKVVGN